MLCPPELTLVGVERALHCCGDALQFNGLKGAVCVRHHRQAAQGVVGQDSHFSDQEDFEQLTADCGERPQEHGLSTHREGTREGLHRLWQELSLIKPALQLTCTIDQYNSKVFSHRQHLSHPSHYNT